MGGKQRMLTALPILVGVIVGIDLGSAIASRRGCITIMRGGWCTHFLGQRTPVGAVLWALVPVVAGVLASLWVARPRR